MLVGGSLCASSERERERRRGTFNLYICAKPLWVYDWTTDTSHRCQATKSRQTKPEEQITGALACSRTLTFAQLITGEMKLITKRLEFSSVAVELAINCCRVLLLGCSHRSYSPSLSPSLSLLYVCLHRDAAMVMGATCGVRSEGGGIARLSFWSWNFTGKRMKIEVFEDDVCVCTCVRVCDCRHPAAK